MARGDPLCESEHTLYYAFRPRRPEVNLEPCSETGAVAQLGERSVRNAVLSSIFSPGSRYRHNILRRPANGLPNPVHARRARSRGGSRPCPGGRRRRDLPFWWRKQTGCYYVQVDGKQVRLAPELDEAWRLYHELMSGKPEEPPRPSPAGKDAGPLVLDVLEAFLEWAEKNKAPLTFRAYRRRLQHFIDSLKAHGDLELPARDLRPIHVTRVLLGGTSWSDTSKNDIVSACQRAFRWAARQGLVEINPLVGMEKPGRRDRELAISPAPIRRGAGGGRRPLLPRPAGLRVGVGRPAAGDRAHRGPVRPARRAPDRLPRERVEGEGSPASCTSRPRARRSSGP